MPVFAPSPTSDPKPKPAQTVYLAQGRQMQLCTALEMLATSTDRELIAMCISHYSGYVREASINRAVELGGSEFLEPIAKRVNDWVPVVRNAATDALNKLLATVAAVHFVALLPGLRDLLSATRIDHSAWLLGFEKRIVHAGGAEAIITAMASADFRLKRTAYLLAIDHQLLPLADLVKRALRSGDIMTAQRAVALLERVPMQDRERCIELAAASPFGPVRYAAFRYVTSDRLDVDQEPFLWRAIFDSQGCLRSAAARLLDERGRDVVGRCIAMLESGKLSGTQIRAGLSLLAERHAPEATAILEKFSGDPRAHLRAHAVVLLARLTPSLKDEIAARALLDPARRVRKSGVRQCALGAFVSLEQIETMLARHGDRYAALAICARNPWDYLACLVLVAEHRTPSEGADDDLALALRKWIDNSISAWTKPGAQHRQILSRPNAGSRLVELARDRHQALRDLLREAGIEM
ncbi:hypothetical protein WK93_27465 [Burkholderia ubonensis]|nr:hypothetical protein WK93_27465 [Burkholderia ubonensis]